LAASVMMKHVGYKHGNNRADAALRLLRKISTLVYRLPFCSVATNSRRGFNEEDLNAADVYDGL
jgi:hypothetical protein